MHPTTGNDASTVFADKDTAMMTCEAAPGCGGIATQSNVCGGKYRINIVEGTEDWKYWPDWELPAWQLWAYDLDRSCCDTCPAAWPTAKPTFEPTAQPMAKPTFEPTAQPTAKPTFEPMAQPTAKPTFEPTAKPKDKPTAKPTFEPTAEPVRTIEPTASTVPPCWEYKQGYYERTTHFISFNGQLDCFGLS